MTLNRCESSSCCTHDINVGITVRDGVQVGLCMECGTEGVEIPGRPEPTTAEKNGALNTVALPYSGTVVPHRPGIPECDRSVTSAAPCGDYTKSDIAHKWGGPL